MLGPAWTLNVLSDTIPTKNNGLSWSWNIVVVTPLYPTQLNSRFFNFTVLGLSCPNPWTVLVVTVIIPVILSYAAVWIPKLNPDDVPIPTILVNPPALFLNALTFAPCNGAYPSPAVDPKETIIPPLGTWFWFISDSETIKSPLVDVIPVNWTVDIPAVVSDMNS